LKLYSPVIVSLQNPKEKLWGVLLSLDPSGVTLRGIDLSSFDDWSRHVANGEGGMALSTLFIPMHRIERLNLDETQGVIVSYADMFGARVGKTIHEHLELREPAVADPSVLQFRPQSHRQREPGKPPKKKPGR